MVAHHAARVPVKREVTIGLSGELSIKREHLITELEFLHSSSGEREGITE
jgi:hypothetical protein